MAVATTSAYPRPGGAPARGTGADAGCWNDALPGHAESMHATSDRPLAVVTGASSGIGLELARQFATNGFDLIVVAEDDAIAAAAEELARGDADVEAVRVDLATDEGVDELYGRITSAGRPVDALALNAGIGAGGAFATRASRR